MEWRAGAGLLQNMEELITVIMRRTKNGKTGTDKGKKEVDISYIRSYLIYL